MKKISAIIEARMSSTRLPGKIMKIANKKPMILHLVNRLKKVSSLNKIIIATTTNKNDDILCNYLKKKKFYFIEEVKRMFLEEFIIQLKNLMLKIFYK